MNSVREMNTSQGRTSNDFDAPLMAPSAVSWGAIVAGAAAAAALSLILLILGTGLGLSSVSPWAQDGISATAFGVSTILWITFTQLVASALGGYIAGRLRSQWTDVEVDEIYFRDTAHGLLAWAVATLATAALLTTVIGSIVGGGIKTGAAVAGGAVTAAVATAADADSKPTSYFVDSLFRKDSAAASDSANTASLAEVSRIFVNGLRAESLPAEDVRHVGQVVAQRTGLSQPEAEKRVGDTFARLQMTLREAEITAKAAADKARKASANAALWLFISLLIGAFIASWTATFGGRQRDL